jgi:putative hydrolase of the HAD superfamily
MEPPPRIRAVTFDLDDTLFDFQTCVGRAGEQVIREICCRHAPAREIATIERFHAFWDTATEEARAVGGLIDWTAVRRRGIALLLRECGCDEGDTLADELTALYFHHRRRPTPPFADAAAVLPWLAERLPLGILTNGNGQLAQIGLTTHFRIVVTPASVGRGKPDPAIFHHAAAALGCAPAELLHVGDRWEDDVIGAHGAGCQAAWYCRAPRSVPDDGVPHLLIRDHRELVPFVLAALDGRAG